VLKSLILQLTILLTVSGAASAYDSQKTPNPPAAVHYKDKALVLMYHEIKDNGGPFALDTRNFTEQLKALQDNGYQVISIEQFEDFMLGKKKGIPANAVVLTFDDGYKDFYEHAFPLLKKFKYPATNFIIVKSTDVYNPKIIPHMTWGDIQKMSKQGMSFYSHTYDSHEYAKTDTQGQEAPKLAAPIYLEKEGRVETDDEYRKRIKSDLDRANKLLNAKVGNKRAMLAFPYGKYSQSTIDVARGLGMNMLFTIDEGINVPGQPLIYRVNAGAPNTTAAQLLETMKRYDDK